MVGKDVADKKVFSGWVLLLNVVSKIEPPFCLPKTGSDAQGIGI